MKKAATSIFVSIATISAIHADDLPTKLNFERYQGMLDHSPFAVATAVIAPPTTPNACKDLYIANAARSSDGITVTLMSTADKDFKKYLTDKEPVDGYAMANVEWSEKVGETKVTISKDGQFCTLTFNQTLIAQPLPNRPVTAPGIVVPGQQQPGFQKSFPTPVGAAPTPHVRGVIPRNPQQPVATPVRTPPPNAEE